MAECAEFVSPSRLLSLSFISFYLSLSPTPVPIVFFTFTRSACVPFLASEFMCGACEEFVASPLIAWW